MCGWRRQVSVWSTLLWPLALPLLLLCAQTSATVSSAINSRVLASHNSNPLNQSGQSDILNGHFGNIFANVLNKPASKIAVANSKPEPHRLSSTGPAHNITHVEKLHSGRSFKDQNDHLSYGHENNDQQHDPLSIPGVSIVSEPIVNSAPEKDNFKPVHHSVGDAENVYNEKEVQQNGGADIVEAHQHPKNLTAEPEQPIVDDGTAPLPADNKSVEVFAGLEAPKSPYPSHQIDSLEKEAGEEDSLLPQNNIQPILTTWRKLKQTVLVKYYLEKNLLTSL